MCMLNINKPIEQDNPPLFSNFEFPVYESEQGRKTIQPYGEALEVIILGTEEDKK